MRPWQHAISSSRAKRPWIEDLEVHEFLDGTKQCCADRRHRMVLHSVDLGVELASLAFPHRPEAGAIAWQHVIEDLGHPYTLADWLERCDAPSLPRPLRRRLMKGKKGVVDLVGRRVHPACQPAVENVYDILSLPLRFVPAVPELALCVLMNSFGPALVRKILGPPRAIEHDHGHVMFDAGWVAEAIILAMFGRIPDLGEIVRCCASAPVMNSTASTSARHGN